MAPPPKKASRRRTDWTKAADRSAPTPRERQAARAPRTKPIRVTLDLDPVQHRELKAWTHTASLDAELPSVSLAQVFRHLGALVVEDQDISAAVIERLAADADL